MAKKPAFMPENCRQCRYLQLDHARNEAGYCRRFPPAVVGFDEDENMPLFSFPVVAIDEWCGEFRAICQ